MSTSTQTRKPVKSCRTIRLRSPIKDGLGVIIISKGEQSTPYLIAPLSSDFGTAYRVVKQELVPIDPGVWELQDAATYHVCLNGPQSTCECMDFLKRGRPCKHISGLTVLRQRNLI
jgi:hypothetical protein